MNHNKNKNYIEIYALYSLAVYYNNDLFVLLENIKRESPDFYSDKLGIGIEVTEALTKTQGNDRFIINEYFGQGLSAPNIISDANQRFGKRIQGKITNYDDIAIYSENKGWYDFNIHLDRIQKCITEKTKKLKSNYKKFPQNWLYIYANTDLIIEEDIPKINYVSNNTDIKFNLIFLNSSDKIFVINEGILENTLVINSKEMSFKVEKYMKEHPDRYL